MVLMIKPTTPGAQYDEQGDGAKTARLGFFGQIPDDESHPGDEAGQQNQHGHLGKDSFVHRQLRYQKNL